MSLGLMRRLTSANFRVFLALPIPPARTTQHRPRPRGLGQRRVKQGRARPGRGAGDGRGRDCSSSSRAWLEICRKRAFGPPATRNPARAEGLREARETLPPLHSVASAGARRGATRRCRRGPGLRSSAAAAACRGEGEESVHAVCATLRVTVGRQTAPTPRHAAPPPPSPSSAPGAAHAQHSAWGPRGGLGAPRRGPGGKNL